MKKVLINKRDLVFLPQDLINKNQIKRNLLI